MADIDLIPNSYRTRRWQTRWMKTTAGVLVGLIVVLAAGLFTLNVATTKSKSRVDALQLQQSLTAQQRADLERLNAEKKELLQQFELLSGLRSGAAAEDMFVTIDRALVDDEVWFLEWEFQRAGVLVSDGVRTVNTGYFIVVPEGADKPADDSFRVQTNMTIRGQAQDHSALSGFVRRLFAQSEIGDVRIRRTSVNSREQYDTVDFDLAVVLNTDVATK